MATPPTPIPRRARVPGMLAVAAPLLLAGLLPLPPETASRWGWSGSWLMPVGDPRSAPPDSTARGTEYRAMRGVRGGGGGTRRHEGVDLSNGRAGGPVRAAGNGLVVKVAEAGWNRGFGRHVVLAHRLHDGELVYSVYAHLAPGAATVRRGEFVGAGRVIGRVGMTGRATSPHLHFEIRRPADPHARWETAPALDPLAFVAARLAASRDDSLWSAPYLEWAECAALVPAGAGGDVNPTRAEWWRALLLATRHALPAVPTEAESLRAAVIELGLLPGDARPDPRAALGWADLAGALPRARELGVRLPWSPVAGDRRRNDCRREVGIVAPARSPDSLAVHREGRPSRALMCLVLADLAADPPDRPRAPRRRPAPPKPAG